MMTVDEALNRADKIGYDTPARITIEAAQVLAAEVRRLRDALQPFCVATLTPTGQIIGLMREDFERAYKALATTDPMHCPRCGKRAGEISDVHTCSPKGGA